MDEGRADDVFEKVGRCTYLQINLDAITHNITFLRSKCTEHTGIMGVIKTAAYGHGSQVLGRHLKSIGVERLAVATVGEGTLLRKAKIGGPIHVFGSAHPIEAAGLLSNDLIPTVSSKDFIHEWSRQLKLEKNEAVGDMTNCSSHEFEHKSNGYDSRKIDSRGNQEDVCHGKIAIKVDTGMSRNGIEPCELENIMKICEDLEVPVDSIMTHFSKSPNDFEWTKKQLDRFLEVALPYRSRGIKLHVANSGAIMNGFGTDLDFVRPGIAMYGLMSASDFDVDDSPMDLNSDVGDIGLKPALAWVARASLIKCLGPGNVVGYNNTHVTETEEIIAVIPAGYGDGFSRLFSNKGFVKTFDGHHFPVVGVVSMDAITVKVDKMTDIERVFYLISDDFDPQTSTFARARQLGTITYNVVTDLSMRIPRAYFSGGKLQAVVKDIVEMY